jgi:hypothetical protein
MPQFERLLRLQVSIVDQPFSVVVARNSFSTEPVAIAWMRIENFPGNGAGGWNRTDTQKP